MTDTALVQRFRDARRDPDSAVLEGFHALKHALRFGADIRCAATDRPHRVRRLARELAPDIVDRLDTVRTVDTDTLDALCPTPPATRVVALADRPRHPTAAILDDAGTAPVVYLDNPRHMGNIGAVIRVAAAAGIDGVLASGEHDPWHPAALRGSAGLHFALPVAHTPTLPDTGRPVLAIDPDGEPLDPRRIPAHAVLAFGSERHGLDSRTLRRADARIAIPMRPGVSSLNLATAVAVLLYVTRTPQP